MNFKLILITFFMSLCSINCINLIQHSILGTPTHTKETIRGSFGCNGIYLRQIKRDAQYLTQTPCTGFTYLSGNDSYELILGDNRIETLELFGPQTFSAYLKGYQHFTQFAPINTGSCTGGFFLTVQLLYPAYYPGCLPPFGLQRAESFYAYIRIQGGQCQADCEGYLNIDFDPPVRENYV